MPSRSTSMSRAAVRMFTSIALLCGLAACGDSRSDPDPASDEGTRSGSATDQTAEPGAGTPAKGKGEEDGKAAAAPAGQRGAGLERPGTLARPPSDGTLPADLRPPR
jgi:hypothetical protein